VGKKKEKEIYFCVPPTRYYPPMHRKVVESAVKHLYTCTFNSNHHMEQNKIFQSFKYMKIIVGM
jgi:hypothetical protein